jgi:hypothetical protein
VSEVILDPTQARLFERLAIWRADPIRFVEDNFQVTPDPWQREFMLGVRDNKRTGAKACKGPGKTCCMAWVGWWFLAVYHNARGYATSINGDNLRDNLWAEFAKWRDRSAFLTEFYEWSAECIYHKGFKPTWYLSARTWPKQADAAQQANTLAGLHEDHTIVLIDEAGDIPPGVASAADASLSTGIVNRIAMTGNPTRLDGALYDCLVKNAQYWKVITITGDPDDPKRSTRLNVDWVREQIRIWGRDHDWTKVNILGQFPAVASDKLLGLEEVERAMGRHLPENEYMYAPLIMGVDVARYGDDRSVLVLRQGKATFPWRIFRNMDLMTLSSEIAAEIEEKQPMAVFVDETGIGSGVVDRLRQLGANVVGINFGQRPRDGRYQDKRSEMWWEMAQWVKDGGALPRDTDLQTELLGPTYSFGATNKLKLESKTDLKSRGLASPDIADALALTFAEPVFVPYGYGTDMWPIERKKLGRVACDYDPHAEGVM